MLARRRGVDSEALLQTHAEAAIALAGFASVVAALRRPLSAFARQRFLSLLALAVIQLVGCLLPLWFLQILTSETTTWRVLSALMFALSAARLWWLVIVPTRGLGHETRVVLGPAVSKLMWGAGYATLLCFLVNTIGIPFPPSFELYYAPLLATLLGGFALFADAAVTER
jgi:hypothetical protein